MRMSKKAWEKMSLADARAWLKENLGKAKSMLDISRGLRPIGSPDHTIDFRANLMGWNWMGVWVQHPNGAIFFETKKY